MFNFTQAGKFHLLHQLQAAREKSGIVTKNKPNVMVNTSAELACSKPTVEGMDAGIEPPWKG